MAETQIQLMPGEELAFEFTADLIKSGTNPVEIAFARFNFFIGKLFGSTATTKLIITNKRVIQTTQMVNCYCIPVQSLLQVIMPNSIKEVGYYSESACLGICKSFVFYFEGMSQRSAFIIKNGDDKLLSDYTAKFYTALNV